MNKKKIKLSLYDEAEWESYFTTEATRALAIKNSIDTTDKEIDQMVYEFYGLSAEEIAIIEKINQVHDWLYIHLAKIFFLLHGVNSV